MNLCKTLIDKFEQSQDQCVTHLENHRHFTEININQHPDNTRKEVDIQLLLILIHCKI